MSLEGIERKEMMNIRHIASILAIALTVIAASSCHDKDDTEYSDSFSGSLKFDVPSYVSPGDVYELVPSGVYTEDETPWGYYWTATPYASERDTTRYATDPASVTGAYTLYVPTDTLCTMTVTCYAFATGYYNTSRSTSVVIIDPDRSLTNLTEAELPTITDSRDGKEYSYSTIGSYDWFSSNLAYEAIGTPYYDCDATVCVYGQFYTYEEAITAFPEGWTLPSLDAWTDLAQTLGAEVDKSGSIAGVAGDIMVDAYLNGTRLWEYWPEVKITNKALFYSLPSGYAIASSKGRSYEGYGKYAVYWTADAVDEDDAYYMYIYLEKPDIHKGSGDRKSFASPVRCVRKSE